MLKHMLCSCLAVVASLIFSIPTLAEGNKYSAYIYPLMDARLSSKFGSRKHPVRKVHRHHNGIDLAAPSETPIRAMAPGQVIFADPHAGYGKLVVILHKDGITSHYGHCHEILVQPGKKVKAGQVIAVVGSTGLATGPHLHLEIRKDGKALNPLDIFPGILADAEG